ncbi:hypothetical protein CEXT_314701 [Caerostris extrusa]|uniref:Uncharacterized protein n=1 Tax=Caerostris extrusa TaxID=172846 RepID=A0AAV4QQ81_CAEEX|nr:hypothetical protein CEXT_314701 [Caerostris extrusa]
MVLNCQDITSRWFYKNHSTLPTSVMRKLKDSNLVAISISKQALFNIRIEGESKKTLKAPSPSSKKSIFSVPPISDKIFRGSFFLEFLRCEIAFRRTIKEPEIGADMKCKDENCSMLTVQNMKSVKQEEDGRNVVLHMHFATVVFSEQIKRPETTTEKC